MLALCNLLNLLNFGMSKEDATPKFYFMNVFGYTESVGALDFGRPNFTVLHLLNVWVNSIN